MPRDDAPTPEYWRALAAKHRADAQRIREVAEIQARAAEDLASLLEDTAEKLQALHAAECSANVTNVTSAQIDRRGAAIARAKAESSGDPFLLAVAASRWASAAKYARRRLRISPSSLSEYRSGVSAVPRRVAEMVRTDLGFAPDDRAIWPKGVVD